MAKVKLHSSMNIKVFANITNDEKTYKDHTNPELKTVIGVKIQPTWQNRFVKIQTGVHEYDEEILEWKSVKSLIKRNIVFVVADAEKVVEKEQVVDQEEKTVVKKGRKATKVEENSLEDLAK